MVNAFTTSLPLNETLINKMRLTQQNPCYHAEGNVLTHTMMVLENVLSLDDSWNLTEEERHILYWAAVLHDIGKPEVTRWEAGRFHSHGHEMAGVPIARNLLLAQKDVTDWQRQQILDLVRWHSIPLQYGLRNKPLSAYKEIAIQTDLRLLGIFSFCDLTGRICKNQEEVKALIMHFNQKIVPQIEAQMGSYEDLQRKYGEASLTKKNRLWKALEYPDTQLLEHLLFLGTTDPNVHAKNVCYIPIGVESIPMRAYFDQRFSEAFRVKIGAIEMESLQESFFPKLLYAKKNILFEGDFTQKELRLQWVKTLREKGFEVRFLFFESKLEDLLAEANDPLKYAEIHRIYAGLVRPHPWEAHKVEHIRL